MATPQAEILDIQEQRVRERQVIELWQMMGATKLANKIVATLNAQSLHALERVRDEKLYVAAGHETFDDFLDHHPDSPMKHDTFRRRINLLKAEGEMVFDLLNSLSIPYNQRKAIAGEIAVDGDELQIGEKKCSLNDQAAIINLIASQHLEIQEKQRTIERGKKDVEKHKARVIEAEKRAVVANPTGTPTGQALLTAAGALTQLREALEVASDEEKAGLSEQIFELMRIQSLELSAALGIATKAEVKAAKNGDDGLGVSDEELNELAD